MSVLVSTDTNSDYEYRFLNSHTRTIIKAAIRRRLRPSAAKGRRNQDLSSAKLASLAMKLTAIRQFLLVLMACCAHVVICSRNGNNTDRLSLLDFKKAISLDPYQALMSWNESSHFCSWEGVLCSLKHPDRVASLNLTSRGLVGQISHSLGNLTFLKVLTLPGNSFTGEIPQSLGHLHRLQFLNLSNNTLQGTIPSLANCSKLEGLWLMNNQLAGQIPADLPRRLQKLVLDGNNLSGTIPTSLANITTLNVFYCVSNNIEGHIPSQFATLSGMQYLYMGLNKLSGPFPQPILNLSNLVQFNIAFNGLSGELPSNIGNSLPNLQLLVLAGNFFHGHIPSGLTNASRLYELDISRNKFTGVVPSSIGKLSKLSWLNLELNKLQASNKQDWNFMDSLANCTELQRFVVGGNCLEGSVPNSLGNLSNQLQYLYLAENQLSGDFPSGIANLRNLIIVSLGGNQFTGVVPEWFGTLKNMQTISLDSNFFTGVIPSTFSNMTQLEGLFLESNKFDGHIPPTLGSLQMLEVLNISNNNLHGSIPKELFRIPTLGQVDLSFNNIDGPIHPDVSNAEQLTNLYLQYNNLSGDIPSTLGDCESLQVIELGHNVFSGSIPTSLGNITSLQVLNLSHNNLTGSIPVSLGSLQHLEQLDVSFNNLNGEVPTKGIFGNATAVRIDGNQGLCGGARELHLLSCSVTPLNSRRHKHSTVKKVVIPLASIVALAIVISVMLLWRGKQKRKLIFRPSFGSNFPKVSYHDLARATEGFATSNLIGRGRYSSVYQGKMFQDRIVVAIKVFSLETEGAHKSFIAECNALRNVRHRNLVPILTACSSIDYKGNDFKALVYEFMPRGDLHALLYSAQDDESTSTPSRITLAQRLSIVVDVADALEYLHHNNQGTIVHCDLKPGNILLDDNMTAHVGDFGLARFKVDSTAASSSDSISTSSVAIKGTIGYVAPECAAGGGVSSAGDVYSFGICLLEVFLRKRPTDDMFKDGLNIARFVEMNFPDRISQIVDPEILEEEHALLQQTPAAMKEKSLECLLSVLNIGLRCAKASPNERMGMREVAARLHGIKEAYLRGNIVDISFII
ncbi:receptor kinase-like protein Xa21 [Phragmites australis]|uniref:receptor kinase-like protein Xa21 n=1 Tax=Phragmites australis TaxID=29695 RepID=UPI002D78BD3C|nr:receptor kinase-like protein Xa21 [Phragmites australis]